MPIAAVMSKKLIIKFYVYLKKEETCNVITR